LTDLNVRLGYTDGLKREDREAYAAALGRSDDDEWMRRNRRGRTLGSEAFAGQLKQQHGLYRRRRGRPVTRKS
jgi:hypothetical protein